MSLLRASVRISHLARLGASELALRSVPPVTGGGDVAAKAWRLHLLLCRACAVHGVRIETHGSLPPRGVVLVSNHLSYLDPIVLGALVPLRPVAKAEVSGWPLVGDLGRALGVMFVRRESRLQGARVLRSVMATLAAGTTVLNFPEGTTTGGEQVLPFKRGVFGAAGRVGAPVVPAYLTYDPSDSAWVGDAAFLPHYLRTARRDGLACRVRFGEAMRVQAGEPAETFAERVRQRVIQLQESTP